MSTRKSEKERTPRDMWPDLETWKKYGLDKGHDSNNPTAVKHSKNRTDRSWYDLGRRNQWLQEFRFERVIERSKFDNRRSWQAFGMQQAYHERTKEDLKKSKEKIERSWYRKGYAMGWLKGFTFEEVRRTWRKFTLEDWISYGKERGYHLRNPKSLAKSEDEDERKWYGKGASKKWVSKFPFKKRRIKTNLVFESFEKWKAFGMQRGYDKRNPSSILASRDKNERAWYGKGCRSKEQETDLSWVSLFPFSYKTIQGCRRRAPKLAFGDFEKWRKFGIEARYHERNPSSLEKSNNPDERSWYSFGCKNGWCRKFPFSRRKTTEMPEDTLETFLEAVPQAAEIASLASVTKNAEEVANLLVMLWPERFPSAANLARSLPKAIQRIGHSLQPFSLEKAKSFYDMDYTIPREIRHALDEMLFSIAVDQYQAGFNEDPRDTLVEIRGLAKERGDFGDLVKRVHSYYKDVFEFGIPGYGKLKDRVA